VKQTPILFNDEMVRAILDGRKTQTRRALKVQPPTDGHQLLNVMDSTDRRQIGKSHWAVLNAKKTLVIDGHKRFFSCPYGKLGDRLWVREAHAFVPQTAYRCSTGIYQQLNPNDNYEACVYRENFDRSRSFSWRPSIHMPRWASRITLEVTDVRVEQLQDVSDSDAKSEGITVGKNTPQAVDQFCRLWRDINGEESWSANPWVWVIEFKRVDSAGYY
jgi:hypothetical protein